MLSSFFKKHFPCLKSRPADGPALLTEKDLDLVKAHYLGLDEAARRHRFGVALSDELLEKWVSTLPLQNDAVLGFFEQEELIGLLYLVPDSADPRRGEAALSVKPSAQGRGIGKRLTQLAMQVAVHAGLSIVDINYQRSNDAMTRITSKLPGSRTYWRDEVHVIVDIAQWTQSQQ